MRFLRKYNDYEVSISSIKEAVALHRQCNLIGISKDIGFLSLGKNSWGYYDFWFRSNFSVNFSAHTGPEAVSSKKNVSKGTPKFFLPSHQFE